jgi:5-formyltetrahydrofolate cyclo-ligase
MQDIAIQKQRLRKQCLQARQALGAEKRRQASQSMGTWIESWPVFQRSDVILTYMPIPGEADLTPLLEWHPQKRWVLPRILPEEEHRMVFHAYDATRLILHPFGMVEPAPDLPVIPPEDVQLTLVPGLAFDRQGWRLGYGGGYFDRFLRHFAGTSLGVIFNALLLEPLPRSEYDVAMQWIVTEDGIFQTNLWDKILSCPTFQ